MEAIKKQQLPEEIQVWFNEVTAGKRQSNFKVYGFNSRFVVLREAYETLYIDRNVQWTVIEWQQMRKLNTFLFKKKGHLVGADKAKIKKDFSIDLEKKRTRSIK